jgi:hypothetical protein
MVGAMPIYLVETYLSREAEATLPQLERQAVRAARQAGPNGAGVRFVRSLFAPDDETWFCVFEAADRDAVERASALAGIECERVVEVVAPSTGPAGEEE